MYGFEGTLPSELARLNASLVFLSLHSNQFRGMLLPAWAALSKLETLDLHSNWLSGTRDASHRAGRYAALAGMVGSSPLTASRD